MSGLAALADGASRLFLALGPPFARLVFVAAFPFEGPPLGDPAPPLALCPTFAFAGCSACGCSGAPRPWMRFQTRLMAVLWSLNFFTRVTPGRLFQMATSLSAGHWAASSANSCSLVKLSNGLAVVAAASSGVPCAVMLFSLSMGECHVKSPGCRAPRGHHMDHSELVEKQGNSDINRRGRRAGDGGRQNTQTSSGALQ